MSDMRGALTRTPSCSQAQFEVAAVPRGCCGTSRSLRYFPGSQRLLALQAKFKYVDDLATVWCEWAEMELRHKNFKRALDLMRRATVPPARAGPRRSQEEMHGPVQGRLYRRCADALSLSSKILESWAVWLWVRLVWNRSEVLHLLSFTQTPGFGVQNPACLCSPIHPNYVAPDSGMRCIRGCAYWHAA